MKCLKKSKNLPVRWEDAPQKTLFYSCCSHFEPETDDGNCIDLTENLPASNWRNHVAKEIAAQDMVNLVFSKYVGLKFQVYKEFVKVIFVHIR